MGVALIAGSLRTTRNVGHAMSSLEGMIAYEISQALSLGTRVNADGCGAPEVGRDSTKEMEPSFHRSRHVMRCETRT